MPTQKGRQQKARKQKGRRHRTVNRTPRPVTRSRPPGSAGQGTGPTAPTATARTAASAAPRPAAETASAGTRAAAPPEPPRQASPAPLPDAPAELFAPVGAGGLGRTAERSWRHLAAAGAEGAGLDEVSAAVGYQQATVTRHLEGLAERGFARVDGERWYAVAPGGVPDGATSGVPARA
ncbi:helix-turn-helix domain-containing protein [Streptomyces sp. NPDC058374]|uniref:helix-turn-helix domain-containing protein n=1 Tax=Streptomyces sp. NPDC058374 TaxID=3346466 RepID=UPI00364C3623